MRGRKEPPQADARAKAGEKANGRGSTKSNYCKPAEGLQRMGEARSGSEETDPGVPTDPPLTGMLIMIT